MDARTAEVVRELRAGGVRPILLKGPAIASWLYGESSHRAYVDTDLLVAPRELTAAERCLARLGFRNLLGDTDTRGSGQPGHLWIRGRDAAVVDLHRTLRGVAVPPSLLWETMSESTELMPVAGEEVEVLGIEARALHVALHAAQHGRATRKPLDDLERALDRLDLTTWAAAASLAERLDATGAFATGLRLLPRGAALAGELGLPGRRPVEVALRVDAPYTGALSLEYLASAPGLLPKLAIACRKIVPTRRFMPHWFPRAARGPSWMALAYLWRPVWLLLKSGPALVAWRRARLEARSSLG